MNTATIDKLCCPFDRADLTLTTIRTTAAGAIDEGYLRCGQCNRMYPIVRGVPIMSPDEYREFELEKPLLDRWKAHLKGKTVEAFRLVDGT